MPEIVRRLAESCEVHYYGMHTDGEVPELIRKHAILHYLPLHFDRASNIDKFMKTSLWYLALPFAALRFRLMGVKAIYNDETVPLTAPLLQLFFGRNVAITVMDFFLDIYGEKAPPLKPLLRLCKWIDRQAWRRLPIIYTKVNYTHEYLARLGVERSRIHTVYNPCDPDKFFPADRESARKTWGYSENDVVLVHHGILHPNKGNDRIIMAISELRKDLPSLRFLLIGDGAEMDTLRDHVRELGIEDIVTMPGWLPSERELNEALNAADVGLVMRIGQYTDNFHLTETLAHEQACGLPIIAADLKGIAEAIVDGETGYLFAPEDMEAFKAKLTELVRNPERRTQFGKASLKTNTDLCSVKRAVNATVDPLLKLVGVS